MTKDVNKIVVEGGASQRTADDREILYVGVPIGLPDDIRSGTRLRVLELAVAVVARRYDAEATDADALVSILKSAEPFFQ